MLKYCCSTCSSADSGGNRSRGQSQSKGRARRRTDQVVELHASALNFRFYSFTQGQVRGISPFSLQHDVSSSYSSSLFQVVSKLAVALGHLEVLDRTATSPFKKMLCYYHHEAVTLFCDRVDNIYIYICSRVSCELV